MKSLKSLRTAVTVVYLGCLLFAQVGINTNIPAKTLEVNGTFRALSLNSGTSSSVFNQVTADSADGITVTSSGCLFSGETGSIAGSRHIYNTAVKTGIIHPSSVVQPVMSKTLTLTVPAKVMIRATPGAWINEHSGIVSA